MFKSDKSLSEFSADGLCTDSTQTAGQERVHFWGKWSFRLEETGGSFLRLYCTQSELTA